MLYREAGDFKTSYRDDSQTFPIKSDRIAYYVLIAVALIVVPFVINDYWANAVLLPFLIYAIAALGLNVLTGYAGQVSLGTGGFMAVGAYASYKLMTSFPDVNIFFHIILSGGITALVGMLFGLPSLRIKGFYLAVATLAAQFFILWLFNKVGWFYNDNPSGTITAPPRTLFGIMISGPRATAEVRYFVALIFLVGFTIVAKNIVRGRIGRSWMAIRDMDIAASIQLVTEEIMLAAARHVHRETGQRHLCLAGGVALNCVGNGRILREGPFDRIWIQPAAGDAGGALGAAQFVWHNLLGKPRTVQPASLTVESQLGDSVIEELRARGHEVTVMGPWSLGRLSCVGVDPERGWFYAAANSRGAQGYAAGASIASQNARC